MKLKVKKISLREKVSNVFRLIKHCLTYRSLNLKTLKYFLEQLGWIFYGCDRYNTRLLKQFEKEFGFINSFFEPGYPRFYKSLKSVRHAFCKVNKESF
jgi:hypothetical protein